MPGQGENLMDSTTATQRLHIFVNRRRFEEGDGVKHEMTGAQIAALVGVPADTAVVREESPEKREIPVNETVHIKNGEHFLVTRRIVEGGYV
jgi:Multiubiquitin